MKRFHVHVAVADLGQSVRFYETLFGAPPTTVRDDYAKWMLDDPRVNFAISSRDENIGLGVDHLGIQVEDARELAAIDARLKDAEQDVRNQADADCCYARSDKAWSTDPSGIAWESFHTHGEITTYGTDLDARKTNGACCAPQAAEAEAKAASSCCS
jgi:catechol 2,3-dioxygenase-like lactoylglutathione lyase family enzyme